MAQPGYLADLCGIKIIEDLSLTETEPYEEEVLRTWRERFVDPLIQFRISEFKPWVKTKVVQKTRVVPSKKAFMWNGNCLLVHPAMRMEIEKQLREGALV